VGYVIFIGETIAQCPDLRRYTKTLIRIVLVNQVLFTQGLENSINSCPWDIQFLGDLPSTGAITPVEQRQNFQAPA
jgi:hypothetical protein